MDIPTTINFTFFFFFFSEEKEVKEEEEEEEVCELKLKPLLSDSNHSR